MRCFTGVLVLLALAQATLAKAGGADSYLVHSSFLSVSQAFTLATQFLNKKQLSKARRAVTKVFRNSLNPSGYRICLGNKYEERAYGYYFPVEQALAFFYADDQCVALVRLDASGFHTV